MKRIVKEEWLDRLSANDPLAEKSRRDIQRLNLLSRHHRIMADTLDQVLNETQFTDVVELGAGNGSFILSVAQSMNSNSNINAVLVDRANGFDSDILPALKELRWKATIEIADVFDWLRHASAGKSTNRIILTNQFLHQFQSAALSEIFRLIAGCAKVLVALEPRRDVLTLLSSHCVGFVGCGAVTRYDAPRSVRAGFTGNELSAVWPDKKNWALTERRAGLFSHLFVAKRKS